MKKKWITAVMICMISAGMSACQGREPSKAETYWTSVMSADSIDHYIRENADTMDLETLREEAVSGDSSLLQQLKATSLLCVMEYEGNQEAGGLDSAEGLDAMFRYSYPESASYANSFLAKVNTEGDAFWEALERAFSPMDYLTPVFAAADQIDGETMTNLMYGMPKHSDYEKKFTDILDKWMERNPDKMLAVTDALSANGYYEDWDYYDFAEYYFNDPDDPYRIHTDTLEEAIAYIGYLRNTLIPKLKNKFGDEQFMESSELTDKKFYSTDLAITVDEEVYLAKPDEDSLPETIELEGKRVVGLYRNPYAEEYPESPAPLRVLGDFMLGLPRKECPGTLKEADYYLVLTPSYETGGVYRDSDGVMTDTQAICSSTALDLYEAGTGRFLRHLGNVIELPPKFVYSEGPAEATQYPELMAADILSYIYHNADNPGAYLFLTDNNAGGTEFERGETAVVRNWEVTYHSCQIVKSFDEGIFRISAEEGCRLVRAEFTIANIGDRWDKFQPYRYDTSEDVTVQLVDMSSEICYDCSDVMGADRSLVNTSLDPGETKEGELIFQVPDEVVKNTESLYVRVLLGNQEVLFPLE